MWFNSNIISLLSGLEPNNFTRVALLLGKVIENLLFVPNKLLQLSFEMYSFLSLSMFCRYKIRKLNFRVFVGEHLKKDIERILVYNVNENLAEHCINCCHASEPMTSYTYYHSKSGYIDV